MAVQTLTDAVFYVGSRDWDRKLFDELIPLPDGTSYNSYLIRGGDKTALIDTVDPEKTHELVAHLNQLDVRKIDYIIANHAEQDHSGSIPRILELYPGARVVTNEKCKDFLMDLLEIDGERFMVVGDNDVLPLGGKTLRFISTPWVHWPETMCTLLEEQEILFSCDFFGSHLATSNLFVKNREKVVEDAKRYFAEIMMPFGLQIRKHLEKLEGFKFKWIAPSHGPVYDDPEMIINAYKKWISGEVVNKVVIAYVSMHGSTEMMVRHLMDLLMDRSIEVIPFNLTRSDVGELAKSLVDAATLIIGTPTVLAGPHPAASYATTLVNMLRPPVKYMGIVGSYGWGGRTVDLIKTSTSNIKAEILPPVLIKGIPGECCFDSLKELADVILEKHREFK